MKMKPKNPKKQYKNLWINTKNYSLVKRIEAFTMTVIDHGKDEELVEYFTLKWIEGDRSIVDQFWVWSGEFKEKQASNYYDISRQEFERDYIRVTEDNHHMIDLLYG